MITQLVIHILHIAATCTSLGGLFYSRMVLLPNLAYVPAGVREAYLKKMINRFAWIKWTGVGVIAVTGIMQWLDVYPGVTDKTGYLVAFAVKMAGATGLFTITFMLAVPDDRFKGMQKRRAFWAGMNIACALTILIGAALMRSVRMEN
jgi:uncharacterized membrane protein